MAGNGDITHQLTVGDKGVRGKICYLPTQWIWWIVLPVRYAASSAVGLILGQNAKKTAYQKILTPANFLTGFRIWLLVEAVIIFFQGTPLARQTEILLLAIITDFFDGPLARNNNEVTELGTYMDHIGDWGIVFWAIFLSFWYGTMPFIWLLGGSAIILILFTIYLAKFCKFYDRSASRLANFGAFAAEELQTDVWGRIQFFCLCIAIFSGLFAAAANNPHFFFYGFTRMVGPEMLIAIIQTSFLIYAYLGGYNTRDALGYSETQARKFKEKLHKLKNASL